MPAFAQEKPAPETVDAAANVDPGHILAKVGSWAVDPKRPLPKIAVARDRSCSSSS
ncbi:hypothetical protein SH611_18640 [Geminicoccaceae bacterium 1502E]|nr:hypothetical protein [Geminicoccaceae bacterium 1502E]